MNKRILAMIFVMITIVSFSLNSISVFAFEEDAIKLDISTSDILVRDTYNQIRNAAIIQLITQKMQRCIPSIQIDGVLRKVDRTFLGLGLGPALEPGVLDRGVVFDSPQRIRDWFIKTGSTETAEVAFGPWFTSLFNNGTGVAFCRDTKLFDSFVYIVKNYKKIDENRFSNFSLDEILNPHVSYEDRLLVVCDIDDPTKSGLLMSAEMTGPSSAKISDKNCNDSSDDGYTFLGSYTYSGTNGADKRENANETMSKYLKKLYDRIESNSDNPYLREWGKLDEYDYVNGFYLYTLDFEKQCPQTLASFSINKGNDVAGKKYVKGFRINPQSFVAEEGYYLIDSAADLAKQSYVNKLLTCEDLISSMNRTIGEYIWVNNFEIFNVCKEAIDVAIADKVREVNEKYLNNSKASSEEIADAHSLMTEYERIKESNEYVSHRNETGEQVLIQARGDFPEDYIFQCREHLPFINVIVDTEDPLAKAIEKEFYDACRNTVRLAWLVCPVVNSITGAVDGLQAEVEEFFK